MIEVNGRQLDVTAEQLIYDIRAESLPGKLDTIKVGTDNIQLCCPFHDEHRPSCFVRKEDFVGHCFSCGAKFGPAKFVGACLGRSPEFGAKWLITRYAGGFEEPRFDLPEIKLHENKQEYLDESILDSFESYHPYMTQRKLTKEVIDKFDIKYDRDTECIVMPVRDYSGKLKFLTRRSVNSKKFIIDKNADKSDVYLLNYFKNGREVYITESQINSLVAISYGANSVATLGAGCTDEQIDRLNSSGIKHFIIAYDPDTAGEHGAIKLCKKLGKDKIVDVALLPAPKDVADLTKEEFDNLELIDRYEYLARFDDEQKSNIK